MASALCLRHLFGVLAMFEKLFGKKEDKSQKGTQLSTAAQSEPASAPASRPATPARTQPGSSSTNTSSAAAASVVSGSAPASPSPRTPVLRVAEDALLAEERARSAMAAVAAAASPPPPPKIDLPEDAGVREQAAAYFAAGEHKRAIDLLVGHLNKTAGKAPKSIWFMLMDAYQALGQQAAFEKSAWLFADFFKTSPPSWETLPSPSASPSPGPAMGRNVLVVDGLPSRAHPEKLKDYVAAARQAKNAKLDLSRTRLDEDHAQRSDDLKVLLQLMRRLRRHQVPTLLMGENQLVEVLRTVIQQDLPVPQADLYWELLLEFMQWRGQEDAYEDLAIEFAKKFGRSAPGYEFSGVIALAPDDQPAPSPVSTERALDPPAVLDDAAMEIWCERLELELGPCPPTLDTPANLDFGKVRMVSFSAAGAFASRLNQWGWDSDAVVVVHPSELVSALFDITGVSGQVHIQPRKR